MNKLLIFCGVFVLCFVAASQTNAQNRKAVGGAEVTGTFREAASGSEFNILALGKGKLRVGFSGVYAYKTASGEDTANTGEAIGEAEIAGDTATFTPGEFEECAIILKFLTGGRLKVTQQGSDAECGFGRNVSADGLYKKVSGKKPKFDAN
ncbi:MAG TPA: hypothetical protein VNI84_01620 [Pyrinomonadaceae bacterium]|nr:hypothetical protein [Pyrinomonadaceae bacterium]